MTVTLKEADELIELAEKKQLVLQVGHLERDDERLVVRAVRGPAIDAQSVGRWLPTDALPAPGDGLSSTQGPEAS